MVVMFFWPIGRISCPFGEDYGVGRRDLLGKTRKVSSPNKNEKVFVGQVAAAAEAGHSWLRIAATN